MEDGPPKPACRSHPAVSSFGSSHCWLTYASTCLSCPLRSMGITPLLHYYGTIRPCSLPQYFRPHGTSACAFSLTIIEQVLKFRSRALDQVHAVLMPETIWAVSRFPPDSSRGSEFPRF